MLPDGWRYCQNIKDPVRLYELIMANKDLWSLEGTLTVLQVLLSIDISSLSHTDVTKAKQLETSVRTTLSVRAVSLHHSVLSMLNLRLIGFLLYCSSTCPQTKLNPFTQDFL